MAVILPESIQRDIQRALPVIPNNGNPAGAYNMASAGPAASPQQAVMPDPYDWLRPSPFMEKVASILEDQDDRLQALLNSIERPQTQGNYNVVTRDGDFHIMPLTDDQLPIGIGYPDPTPYTYALPEETVIPLPIGE